MGVRSIIGSFGGAIAHAKTFSLTQVKFQFNNEQKFKYCVTLKRLKILKQKVKNTVKKLLHKKHKPFGTFFAFLSQHFQSFIFSSSALA